MPENIKPELMILVDPPHWPKRPLLVSILYKLHISYQDDKRLKHVGKWWRKLGWHAIYSLNVVASAKMLRRLKADGLWQLSASKKVIILNQNDPFFSDKSTLDLEHGALLLSLPGSQDHLWQRPDPYIRLLDRFTVDLT